jgi:hypothetical protein
VIEVNDEKVFVKRIPLTDLECENPFSTRNLYSLPTFYNYGVGSAGFGAFRELVANVKTTNWVLDGQIETFPLLYHYRIRQSPQPRPPVDRERHAKYVEYWAGNENIGRYMLERAAARHELVLFLEYIPDVLDPWLKENLQHTDSILAGLSTTLRFLREKGINHFDAHFNNILIDEDRAYLTDFGLVLDESFDLSEEERAFYEAHTYYDGGEAISCLSYVLCGEEPVYAGAEGARLLEKYGAVIALMNDFYHSLRSDISKTNSLSITELHRLLVECGFDQRLMNLDP